MKCQLIQQGYKTGSCQTRTGNKRQKACDVTLKRKGKEWFRLVKSAHLSRPEHYFSIYQSGCNHHCLKCHSWEFSQFANGSWISAKEIGEMAKEYEKKVTIQEERARATMWHGTDLCRSCGSCLVLGKRSWLCPGSIEPKDVVLSPQGFGPARNIMAFTGGDLSCCAGFYCQAAEYIKSRCQNMWVLIETNGYGLTPENLDKMKDSGVDSFWLDIKAFDDEVYRKLCGTTNEWVLKAPSEIVKRDFMLEVLTLFIPDWVETDQIEKIARVVHEANPDIPITILAFFPAYKMKRARAPTLPEMLDVFHKVKNTGLKNVKLGNCGVFTKTNQEWEKLLNEVGKEGIG